MRVLRKPKFLPELEIEARIPGPKPSTLCTIGYHFTSKPYNIHYPIIHHYTSYIVVRQSKHKQEVIESYRRKSLTEEHPSVTQTIIRSSKPGAKGLLAPALMWVDQSRTNPRRICQTLLAVTRFVDASMTNHLYDTFECTSRWLLICNILIVMVKLLGYILGSHSNR